MDNNPGDQDPLTFQLTHRNGILFCAETLQPVFCKPKLIPLKSVTLEKLEKMQQEALDKLEELEKNEEDINEGDNLKANSGKHNNEIEGMKSYSKKTDVWSADD
uniref:BBSome-interacting protein 1 n=1 Tax=Strongyloides papillosus TaxID=174720 RepID=A0A0N5BKL4_STREA